MEPPVSGEPKKRKPRGGPSDKAFVTLNKELTAKVAQQLEHANRQLRGVQVTRVEFVAWLLETALDPMGKEEIQAFKAKFQSEEGRLNWAREELKRRQSAGESPTLEEILKSEASPVSLPKRPRRRKAEELLTNRDDNLGVTNAQISKTEPLSFDRPSDPVLPPETGED